jgi:hypothetical protein
MGFIEELMAERAAKVARSMRALKDEAAQVWREKFVPIPDLKAGDKVRFKTGCRDSAFPKYGEIVEVFGVFPPISRNPAGGNHDLDLDDFSVAVWDEDDDGGTFYLFAFDSRRFERVVE